MDQIYRWNRWYEGLPEDWRFQTILGPLIFIGFINMLLTGAFGFPFGLLVLLGIAAVICIRAPYVLGWIKTEDAVRPGQASATTVELHDVNWLHDVNAWHDDLHPSRQFWVIPAVLLAAGFINMWLTIAVGFPFGLLFLIVLLIVLAVRVPYVSGWVKPPHRPTQELAHATAPVAITADNLDHHPLMASRAEAPLIVRETEPAAHEEPRPD